MYGWLCRFGIRRGSKDGRPCLLFFTLAKDDRRNGIEDKPTVPLLVGAKAVACIWVDSKRIKISHFLGRPFIIVVIISSRSETLSRIEREREAGNFITFFPTEYINCQDFDG